MSMRTKRNGRTLAVAARLRANTKNDGQRSFASGLLMGLSAASLFVAGEIPPPTIPQGDLRSDWRAVRKDIEAATKKHGGKTA